MELTSPEPCDLDCDGDCDRADYQIFLNAVHGCYRSGPKPYNPRADANGDGCVDLQFDEALLFPVIPEK